MIVYVIQITPAHNNIVNEKSKIEHLHMESNAVPLFKILKTRKEL